MKNNREREVKLAASPTFRLPSLDGLIDGAVMDGKAVEDQLATMPGKDELRATLLATLQAPLQQFVMLLNAPAQNFVYADVQGNIGWYAAGRIPIRRTGDGWCRAAPTSNGRAGPARRASVEPFMCIV